MQTQVLRTQASVLLDTFFSASTLGRKLADLGILGRPVLPLCHGVGIQQKWEKYESTSCCYNKIPEVI